MRVGVAGMGKMGSGMALRLFEKGFNVTVWNRTAAKAKAVADRGPKLATSPADLVGRSDAVITMLTDDLGVRSLFSGSGGFLSQAVAGKIFLEMSTLRPDTLRELASLVEARDARIIGAPVGGSINTARAGELLVTAGGASEDVARAEPVLSALARRIIHVGPIGSGNVMALIMRMGMAVYNQFIGEALAMGVQEGVTCDAILDVLTDGPLTCRLLTRRMSQYKDLRLPDAADCSMSTARKDVLSAIATGIKHGIPMTAATAALEGLSAAVAGGWGTKDFAELPRFLRDSLAANSSA